MEKVSHMKSYDVRTETTAQRERRTRKWRRMLTESAAVDRSRGLASVDAMNSAAKRKYLGIEDNDITGASYGLSSVTAMPDFEHVESGMQAALARNRFY